MLGSQLPALQWSTLSTSGFVGSVMLPYDMASGPESSTMLFEEVCQAGVEWGTSYSYRL